MQPATHTKEHARILQDSPFEESSRKTVTVRSNSNLLDQKAPSKVTISQERWREIDDI